LLLDRGADLCFSDPHVPEIALDGGGRFRAVPLEAGTLRGADLVVILTNHSAWDYDFVVRHAGCVLDTRNATRGVGEGREKIRRL
jgi:UDP-N-acetyl-D-glucosamine dehydrogenase